jgi:hypothetical protein
VLHIFYGTKCYIFSRTWRKATHHYVTKYIRKNNLLLIRQVYKLNFVGTITNSCHRSYKSLLNNLMRTDWFFFLMKGSWLTKCLRTVWVLYFFVFLFVVLQLVMLFLIIFWCFYNSTIEAEKVILKMSASGKKDQFSDMNAWTKAIQTFCSHRFQLVWTLRFPDLNSHPQAGSKHISPRKWRNIDKLL